MAKSSILVSGALAAGMVIGAGGAGEMQKDLKERSETTVAAMERPNSEALKSGIASIVKDGDVAITAYCKKGDGQAPQPYMRCSREMKAGELFEVLAACEGEETDRAQYLIPDAGAGKITKAIVTVSFYTDIPATDRAKAIDDLMAAEAAKEQPSEPVGGIK